MSRKKRWAVAALGLLGFGLVGVQMTAGWPLATVGLAITLGAVAWGVSESSK